MPTNVIGINDFVLYLYLGDAQVSINLTHLRKFWPYFRK